MATLEIRTNSKGALLWIAIATCCYFSCSPSIEKIEILKIGNIRVDSITREMIAIRAEVTVKNPYYSPARLKDISFDLSFTDHPVAYGKLAGSTEIKALQTLSIDVPLVVSCTKITPKDYEAFLTDRSSYRIDGSAILDKPFGPRSLAIHVINILPAPGLLRLHLNNKTALDILRPNVSGAAELASLIRKKELSMRFYNPFSFDLSADPFRYEIRLGANILANGRSAEPLQLRPGANRFAVTVESHPVGLAGNLLDLLITRTIPDLTLESNFTLLNSDHSLKIQLLYSPAR